MNSIHSDDGDLRARFRALASSDAAAALAYSRAHIDARRAAFRARRARRVWYSAAGIALAGAAAAVTVVVGRPAPPFPVDLSSTTWVAPTDFLLNTPGSELLRSVPTIGSESESPSTNAAARDRGDTSGGHE